jgi:hypothetical protein
MKFGNFFRMKFRNCNKSGKANAEIFSELPWNNFRIWQYFLNKGGSFRPKFEIPNFFPRSIRIIPNFFSRSFGVFGQFRIFFRAHSDNSEFFFELIRTIPNFFPSSLGQFRTDFRIICGKYMEIHQNPVFSRKYFFSHSEKSEYSELYFPN